MRLFFSVGAVKEPLSSTAPHRLLEPCFPCMMLEMTVLPTICGVSSVPPGVTLPTMAPHGLLGAETEALRAVQPCTEPLAPSSPQKMPVGALDS